MAEARTDARGSLSFTLGTKEKDKCSFRMRAAFLRAGVPIQLFPPVPVALQHNVVDCAIAEGQFRAVDRDIYWGSYVRGWRRRAQVRQMVGQTIKNTGRTTNFTTGRITAVNAAVDVS